MSTPRYVRLPSGNISSLQTLPMHFTRSLCPLTPWSIVRSLRGMPGSETALEELMCGVLFKDCVVAKIADDLNTVVVTRLTASSTIGGEYSIPCRHLDYIWSQNNHFLGVDLVLGNLLWQPTLHCNAVNRLSPWESYCTELCSINRRIQSACTCPP